MKTVALAMGLLLVLGPLGLAEDVKIDWVKAQALFQKSKSGGSLTAEEQKYLEEAKRQHDARQGQAPPASGGANGAGDGIKIDWEKAKALYQRSQSGGTLTEEEQKYLDAAKSAMRRGQGPGKGGGAARGSLPKDTKPSEAAKGLVPLTELTAQYQGRDGGLYGAGKNQPPAAQQALAAKALASLHPLGADGKPSPAGQIVLMSIGMSNTTMEFSAFVSAANQDPRKAEDVRIVDAAQGGMAAAQWSTPNAPPWSVAENRLKAAGVTPEQVQVLWIKQANVHPTKGRDAEIQRLQDDMQKIVTLAKEKYPNVKLAFLSSRIYGGYAQTPLNPEPYAYEGAFSMRGLILKQMSGDAALNPDPSKGEAKAPVLLWGPYLWAAGPTPRASDGLTYLPEDFGGDGTHPSATARQKVAKLLLNFFTTDANATPWFLKKG